MSKYVLVSGFTTTSPLCNHVAVARCMQCTWRMVAGTERAHHPSPSPSPSFSWYTTQRRYYLDLTTAITRIPLPPGLFCPGSGALRAYVLKPPGSPSSDRRSVTIVSVLFLFSFSFPSFSLLLSLHAVNHSRGGGGAQFNDTVVKQLAP